MRRLKADRRNLLTRMLTFGLELRAGLERPLGRDRAVYESLCVLAVDSPSLRPCERCSVPFPAQRANALRCPRCRSRREPKPRPHHQYAVVEDVYETTAEPSGYKIAYYGECQHPGCERCFRSERADTTRCLNHREGAGRQRAASGGSSLGRRLYRYVSRSTDPLNTVSIVHIRLTAVDGVIETRDLEVVAALDAKENLRRLDPSERVDRSLARKLRKQRESDEGSDRLRGLDFYRRRLMKEVIQVVRSAQRWHAGTFADTLAEAENHSHQRP